MKIRTCYVSNSSSSSFIVTKDLTSQGISCIKLTEGQLELLNGYKAWESDEKSFNPEKNKEYYLTEYISDGRDDCFTIRDMGDSFTYCDGGHFGPYDEEMFNEYQTGFNSVWLRKEHDEAKQMSFAEFIKIFIESHGNPDVIVSYEGNSVNLKFVD